MHRMICPHNIYIHVPFCMSKCNYCAFFSRACSAPDWVAYLDGIVAEVKHWAQILPNAEIPTIFFGGGTPSLMPVRVFDAILRAIKQNFRLSPNCEISIEANPGTLSDEKLSDFCSAGVNRLSVGVQSLDDSKLRFLGRRHSARDALMLLDCAHSRGVRLSADFIYGLPHETPDDIVKTCTDINGLKLSHCSMYELTIEPNAPFGQMNLDMPSNDAMADMYCAIGDTLNLPRYEVSNYATPGHECRHNLNIWHGAPYIGIGNGAAGRVYIDGQWYEQLGAGQKFTPISNRTRAIERIITGMRTLAGIDTDGEISQCINWDFVDTHPDLVVKKSENQIAPTNAGILILDDMLTELIR